MNFAQNWNLVCVGQVAAKALETAVFGAYYNVMINLKDVSDEAFRLAVSHQVTFHLSSDIFH